MCKVKVLRQFSTPYWLSSNHGKETACTDFGEVRMTVLQHYRGSTNCLGVVRGIV